MTVKMTLVKAMVIGFVLVKVLVVVVVVVVVIMMFLIHPMQIPAAEVRLRATVSTVDDKDDDEEDDEDSRYGGGSGEGDAVWSFQLSGCTHLRA